MNLRPTPPVATWFLNQFGPASEDESSLGDLVEQYQRGHGSIWYWRQVLVIVFLGLFREALLKKRQFVGGLIRTWCLWGVLQFIGGIFLMMRYVALHPINSLADRYGMTASGFPFLTLRIHMGNQQPGQWEIGSLCVLWNVLTLVIIGRLATSSRNQPQTLLLAFVTTFVVADVGLALTSLLMIPLNQPTALGLLITSLIALPLVPALILIGGMRGLSPMSPQIKR